MSDIGQIRSRQAMPQRGSCLEFVHSFSTITTAGASAVTGLMVGMANCTSIGTETLAVTDNGTGILNLAGASGTSADSQSRCHESEVNALSLTL